MKKTTDLQNTNFQQFYANNTNFENIKSISQGLINTNKNNINPHLETYFTNVKNTCSVMQKYPHDNKKESILICGDTGAGKSTLINYLLDKTPIAKPKEYTKQFYIEYKDEIAKVGHDVSSATSIPQKCEFKNYSFWDCPGFDDNRGSIFDISNSFGMEKINTKIDQVKIIALVEEGQLSSRKGQGLRNTIDRLFQMFPEIKDLSDHVSFCFTKTGRIKDYQSELIAISQEKNDLKPNQKNFLLQIATKKRFSLFPSPKKEGIVSDDYKKDIIYNIDKSIPTKSKINPVIAPRSLIELDEVFNYTNDKSLDILNNIFNKILGFAHNLSNNVLMKFTNDIFDTFTQKNQDDINIINSIENSIKYSLKEFIEVKELEANFDELRFHLNEILRFFGYFIPAGDRYEPDTFQIPLQKLIEGIKPILKQKGLDQFVKEIENKFHDYIKQKKSEISNADVQGKILNLKV